MNGPKMDFAFFGEVFHVGKSRYTLFVFIKSQ